MHSVASKMLLEDVTIPNFVIDSGIPVKTYDEAFHGVENITGSKLKIASGLLFKSINDTGDSKVYYAIKDCNVYMSHGILNADIIKSCSVFKTGVIYEVNYEDIVSMTIMNGDCKFQMLLNIKEEKDLKYYIFDHYYLNPFRI